MIPGIARPFWQRPAVLALIAAAFAIPFLLGTIPPLIDLPTHMARYRVGAGLAESPFLQRYFTYEWRFMPNLGVDILAIGLSRLIGLELAVRIIVAAIPALMAGGMLWIAHEAQAEEVRPAEDDARSIPATALVALPLAFGYPMTFGFVNACLANALAFIAFAFWLRLGRRGQLRIRALAFALIAPLILTTHILGFLLLGALISGSELATRVRRGASITAALGQSFIACLPIAWPVAILLLWHTGAAPPSSGWLDWRVKGAWLIGVLRDRWLPLDLASAAIVYGTMLLPLLLPRRFGWRPALALPAIILWAAALILPTTMITQFASVRLIYIATAIAILAVRPRAPLPPIVPLLALGFVMLRLLTVSISTVETGQRLDRELAALDHVERGSRVIAFTALDCARAWAPPRLEHLPSFATTRRDAFVNDHFITTEGQLMGYRRDLGALGAWSRPMVFTEPCGRWQGLPVLRDALAQLPWDQVDYLWLIDVPRALRPRRTDLQPSWQQGNSILYRVTAATRH